MKRVLILFTHKFPDEKSEVFLWNELPYMNYDHIFIFSMIGTNETSINVLNKSNISVFRCGNTLKFPQGIIWWLKSFIRVEFWREILLMFSKRKLNFDAFKRLLRTTSYGERIFTCVRKKIDFSEVNCSFAVYAYWMTSLAYAAVRLRNVYPSVRFAFCRCHGHDLYCYRYKNDYIEYQKYYLDNLDIVMPISSNGVEYLNGKYSFDISSRLCISRLGTEDHGIQTKKNNDFVIVSCSSMIPLKRINKIIDALSLIESLDIKWIHYGDGELYADLKAYAQRKIGNKKNINFEFAGHISNNELMKQYKNLYFDLFINVSENEGIPVSIMEALSFGIPVIATNVGGCSEIVDQSCGYLIPKDFSDSYLSGLIEKIYKLSEFDRGKLRDGARKMWQERFSADTNYRNLHSLIINKL